MKTFFRYLNLALAVIATVSTSLLFSSCETEEDNEEEELYLRIKWGNAPQSYIKFFDSRMKLRFYGVMRSGSNVHLDYALTNVGFRQDVTLLFYLDESAVRDDLGNIYKPTVMIDGRQCAIYDNGTQVTFMPNQTISGSYTIENFNPNAKRFSISCSVRLIQPSSGITLAYDHLDFVDILAASYRFLDE